MFKLLAESGVLAILLAIAGWVFVYKNSRSLARQSEANSLTASIEGTLQDISKNNYEFWTKTNELPDKDFSIRCRMFQYDINHKCNLIEEKIHHLAVKTYQNLTDKDEILRFENKTTELIACIRNVATLDSEEHTLGESYRNRKILSINSLTLELFSLANHYLIKTYSSQKYKTTAKKMLSLIQKTEVKSRKARGDITEKIKKGWEKINFSISRRLSLLKRKLEK